MSRLSILLIVALLANPVAAQPKDPKPGEVRRFEIAKGVFMEFCWIPPGECQLGSCKEEQDYVTKNHYGGNRPDYLDNETESKRGKFKTKGFWLGKYTVTQAEWKAVMGDNPSWFGRHVLMNGAIHNNGDSKKVAKPLKPFAAGGEMARSSCDSSAEERDARSAGHSLRGTGTSRTAARR
jgi:formylglycine-generating enzyme required for sulfatase activity